MSTAGDAGPTPSLTMARSMPQALDEISAMGPFELFQSQMAADGSTEAKVDAMKRLSTVAFALGVEKTVTQVFPYLTQNVAMKQPPQEDEVLLILAQQLQLLVPHLFREPTQLLLFLPILERLATMEETVVRDEAVKATNHILPLMASGVAGSDKAVQSQLVSMVKRLATADWFTSKVSAAGMFPTLYQVTADDDLRFVVRDLCQEETPMVRRAAAKHFGKFLALQTPERMQELHPILEAMCRDEQDSVRLLAVASLADIGTKWAPEWTVQALLPLVRQGATDLSWRVRNHLAKVFSDVALNLSIGGANSDTYAAAKSTVMSCFVALLQDVEGDVRASAVHHLARMVHWGGPVLFQQKIHPLLPALADDVVVDVRSKCALAVMDSSEGGTLEDGVIVKSFGPLLENFLQDEYPEVQLNVLNNLSRISHLLPQMSGVVSVILNMSKNGNWRVRQGVATLLPHLADARGMEFFSSVLLEPAWLALLLDSVASVRMACIGGLPKLVQVAGDEWMITQLLPHHVKIYDHSTNNYLMRMTILKGHTQICLAGSSTLVDQVLPQLLRGLTDKVPNVRRVTMLGFQELVGGGGGNNGTSTTSTNATTNTSAAAGVITEQYPSLKTHLEQALAKESDPDCRQVGEDALQGF